MRAGMAFLLQCRRDDAVLTSSLTPCMDWTERKFHLGGALRDQGWLLLPVPRHGGCGSLRVENGHWCACCLTTVRGSSRPARGLPGATRQRPRLAQVLRRTIKLVTGARTRETARRGLFSRHPIS